MSSSERGIRINLHPAPSMCQQADFPHFPDEENYSVSLDLYSDPSLNLASCHQTMLTLSSTSAFKLMCIFMVIHIKCVQNEAQNG